MYKLIFFCCVNIISLIHAAPIDNNPKIYDILQLDFLNKCPAILNNNIDLHCKNVSIGNPPQKIEIINLNDFYCVGLLAADIQLCVGNNTKKILKNYDDLKTNIDKIQKEKPADICKKLKQMTLFNETKNITNLKKWIDVLDQNLHDAACVGLCTDVEDGHTNLFCSMVYYINNDITYAVKSDKKETPLVSNASIIPEISKTDTVTPPVKDNAQQQKQTTTLVSTSAPLIKNTVKIENKVYSTGASVITTSANIKDNTTKPVVTKVDTINQQQQQQTESPKQQQVVVVSQQSATEAAAPATPVDIKDETLEAVKTVKITEEAKLPPNVNEVPSVEENPKVASNVESSSVSSTVSGVRDDFGEEYGDEMDEFNKENEDQLLPQTNSRKETIEILSDQDRHRMPTEDGDDMEESNFFSYFMFVSVMFIAGYVVYHNKQKIMALLLEGRRDRNSRRRPNTASYRKLNSNLEEAVTSKCSGSASHVIY